MPSEKITFACNVCNHKLSASPDKAGKVVECPNCHDAVRIPIPATTQNCPECGATQIKKASLVFEQGTTSGSITGVGLGMDGESADLFLGGTQTKSLLAQRVAPPSRPSAIPLVLSALFGLLFLLIDFILFLNYSTTSRDMKGAVAFIIVMFGLLAVAMGAYFFLGMKRYPKATAEYNYRLNIWNRMWVCLRCGKTWACQ